MWCWYQSFSFGSHFQFIRTMYSLWMFSFIILFFFIQSCFLSSQMTFTSTLPFSNYNYAQLSLYGSYPVFEPSPIIGILWVARNIKEYFNFTATRTVWEVSHILHSLNYLFYFLIKIGKTTLKFRNKKLLKLLIKIYFYRYTLLCIIQPWITTVLKTKPLLEVREWDIPRGLRTE